MSKRVFCVLDLAVRGYPLAIIHVVVDVVKDWDITIIWILLCISPHAIYYRMVYMLVIAQ